MDAVGYTYFSGALEQQLRNIATEIEHWAAYPPSSSDLLRRARLIRTAIIDAETRACAKVSA